MFSIVVTESAEKDLTQIVEYLANTLSNPKAATDFLDRVEEYYSSLEHNPLMFEACRNPHLNAQGYRRAVIKKHIMVYKIEERNVIILGFIYARRDFEKLV